MALLDKQVTIVLGTSFVIGIASVIYAWAAWTTETLIAVDKRTEVMATQIEFIKLEMERTYGNVPSTDASTSVQASAEE